MSADTDTASPKKKGMGLIMKLVLVLLLLAAGGGVAFGLQVAGYIGGGGGEGHAEEDKPDVPQLLRKGEEDPYAVKTEGEGEGEEAAEVAGEGGSKYRTAYFVFADDFTSNLKDSAALIQTRIAVSTHYDGRVLMWLKKHELAIRSRIFVELADTPEVDVLTPDGKQRLQKRLAGAINEVLTEAEGFGGVDAVYFQSLMVQ
jgi:flagellar FliL protein